MTILVALTSLPRPNAWATSGDRLLIFPVSSEGRDTEDLVDVMRIMNASYFWT
jgi:hypothetical protein